MRQVDLETTAGTIRVELDDAKAPETVKNFINNVENGHYDNTVFHRVIKGFMVQGGGFEPGMSQKPTGSTIQTDYTTTARLEGQTPKLGGSYRLDFSSVRLNTNNSFVALNPQYPTVLSFSFRAPRL